MCFEDLAPFTLRRRNLKTQTITGNFGDLCLRKIRSGKSRDRLVWTVGLTIEINLLFQISSVSRGRVLNNEELR